MSAAEMRQPCQTCLSLLSLWQRTAYVGWIALEKIGDLRSEMPLLQYGFADESITRIYYAGESACEALARQKDLTSPIRY
jgi:hypothetical protein